MDLILVAGFALVAVAIVVNGVLAQTTPVMQLAPGSWADPKFLAQLDASQPEMAAATRMGASALERQPQVDALLAENLTETIGLRKDVSDLRNRVGNLAREVEGMQSPEGHTSKQAA